MNLFSNEGFGEINGGGGIFFSYSGSNIIAENTITNNTCGQTGGGMETDSGSSESFEAIRAKMQQIISGEDK
jgi:hypothetical protein